MADEYNMVSKGKLKLKIDSLKGVDGIKKKKKKSKTKDLTSTKVNTDNIEIKNKPNLQEIEDLKLYARTHDGTHQIRDTIPSINGKRTTKAEIAFKKMQEKMVCFVI